jgi:hypothetical protein
VKPGVRAHNVKCRNAESGRVRRQSERCQCTTCLARASDPLLLIHQSCPAKLGPAACSVQSSSSSSSVQHEQRAGDTDSTAPNAPSSAAFITNLQNFQPHASPPRPGACSLQLGPGSWVHACQKLSLLTKRFIQIPPPLPVVFLPSVFPLRRQVFLLRFFAVFTA